MKLPTLWPFRDQDIHKSPPSTTDRKDMSMAQVNARKAGKPYKQRKNQEEAKAASKPKGRTNADGTSAVIKLETLQTRLDHLIDLHIKSQDASETYTEAVKAVAEASGLLSSVVSRYVKARAGTKYSEEKEKVLQLSLCFDIPQVEASRSPKEKAADMFKGDGNGDPDDEEDGDEDDGVPTGPGAVIGDRPAGVH
jgi:hypothetical protein